MSDKKMKSIDERMNYFANKMHDLFAEVGFTAGVLVLRVDDEHFVAARYPSCSDACETVDECTAKVFSEAASDLTGQAEKIRARTIEDDTFKRTGDKKGGGYIQ